MAHHVRTNNPGDYRRRYAVAPQWPPRRNSYSSILRGLLHDVNGTGYDRDPCPHMLRTHDLIDDPARPAEAHRRRVRAVDRPCVRPGTHRDSKDATERLHADAAGRTW